MNYLYKITNLINNKIYIGVHKTDNIDDGYMGSGKIIKSAIKKYGIENFKKDILEIFDTYDAALLKEAEIVTDEFLLRTDVYNLRRGGTGGFDYINANNLQGFKLFPALAKQQYIHIQNLSPEQRSKRSSNGGKVSSKLHMTRKTGIYDLTLNPIYRLLMNSDEAIEKKKNTFKDIKHQQGTNNSQFNTCWVYNLELKCNKKIKKSELEKYISESWKKGRVIEFPK